MMITASFTAASAGQQPKVCRAMIDTRTVVHLQQNATEQWEEI